MDSVLTPDLCVIGASPAGLAAASMAASFGVSVVLIERGAMGEGDTSAGDLAALALMDAARKGIPPREGERPSGDALPRARALGVQVVAGDAHFVDRATVRAGDHLIRARHVIVATGSHPVVPPIPGLATVPAWTADTIGVRDGQGHLIVLGDDPSGLATAQGWRRRGARATVLATGSRLLQAEDPEMAAAVERALRRDGIAIHVDVRIERAEPEAPDGFRLRGFEGETPLALSASRLLLTAGRQPDTGGLRLDAGGIETDGTGAIRVDRGLKSTNARVYAVGGCTGEVSRHGAIQQAGLAVRNALFRLPVRMDQAAIPRFVPTEPELASVGLLEDQARLRHRDIRILRWPFAENDRARIEGVTDGHVKAVTTPRGRILGCTIVGARAGELILPWMLAIAKDLRVSDLAALPVPHPTLSDVTRQAGIEFLKPATQNPWLRRMIHLTRFFGAPR